MNERPDKLFTRLAELPAPTLGNARDQQLQARARAQFVAAGAPPRAAASLGPRWLLVLEPVLLASVVVLYLSWTAQTLRALHLNAQAPQAQQSSVLSR